MKQRKYSAFLIFTGTILFRINGSAYQIGNDPFRRGEYLDPDKKYLLEWQADWSKEQVHFNISVETKGWIGFGLGNDGSSADYIVGGVKKDVTAYFSDRHISGGNLISTLDWKQDWTLNSASEDGKRTLLSLSRAFDTCDKEDFAITSNRITLIWAYGLVDDEYGLLPVKNGLHFVHLLDPDYAPEIIRGKNGAPSLITSNRNEQIPKDTKVWSIPKRLRLPKNDTNYLCSVHKAPNVSNKNHLIGFDLHFNDEISRAATHHLLFFKCKAPKGFTDSQLFSPYLGREDQACYLPRPNDPDALLFNYCDRIHMQFTIGGTSFFFPNHVGMEFGSTPDQPDFYMAQMHYDNPNSLSNLNIDISLDFFYTDKLRPNQVGMMFLDHDIPGLPESFTIPPNSLDHKIYAHCPEECSRRMLRKEGISVFAGVLHGHNAGVGMRIRHFREGKELPWILFDDNYGNNFQVKRHLRDEVRVLPGDRLTLDCHYNTNGTVVGGFSTRQEMCGSVIMFYNEMEEYGRCGSSISSEEERYRFLGIRNVSWVEEELEWVVNSPSSLSGLTVSEVSNTKVKWTEDKRRSLQRLHELGSFWGGCSKNGFVRDVQEASGLPVGVPTAEEIDTEFDYRTKVTYPFDAKPYQPKLSKCLSK